MFMETQRISRSILGFLVFMLLALSLCSQANAFTWRDDPFSFPDTSKVGEPATVGNSITYSGFEAVNASPFVLPSLGVIVPWIFPVIDGSPISMGWSNAQDGWINSNVNGHTLLVTLDNFTDRLRFGDVAGDAAGTVPLNPTRTFGGISETRGPDDLVPFLDLGSFAPNESKPFSLTFTYHFDDGRLLNGAVPSTPGFLNTVSPVPEPESYALLLAGLGLMGGIARRRKQR
jgi:hypothetical protein